MSSETSTLGVKKIILTIITFAFLLPINTFANDFIFYGEKDNSWFSSEQEDSVKAKIDEIQKKYKLNMDIIILGANDPKGCYNEVNIDSCVQKNYNFASDLIVVVKMKSALSNRGDMRSLVIDKFTTILNPSTLKSFQDLSIEYFKRNDFVGGVLYYTSLLEANILETCEQVHNGNDCSVSSLVKDYEASQNKQSIYKMIIFISFVFSCFGIYFGMRKYYLTQLKKLHTDLIYRKSALETLEIFEDSKVYFMKMYEVLKNNLERYLADKSKSLFKVKKAFKESSKESQDLDEELNSHLKNFLSQENIKNQIENMKKIDL